MSAEEYYEDVGECLERKGLWGKLISRIPPLALYSIVEEVYNAYVRAGLDPKTLDWCTAFSEIAEDPDIRTKEQALEFLREKYHVPLGPRAKPPEAYGPQPPTPEECEGVLRGLGYVVLEEGEYESLLSRACRGYAPEVKVVGEAELKAMGVAVKDARYRDVEREREWLHEQARKFNVELVEGLARLEKGDEVARLEEGELKLALAGGVPVASSVRAVVLHREPSRVVVAFIVVPLSELRW